MKNAFLEGKSIYLRPLLESDLDGNYIHWLNDKEVCQFNGHHVFPYTREAGENYVRSVKNSRTVLVLAIIHKESGMHVGNISLQNISQVNQNAELAILLGERSVWGKGYGKEASLLLAEHGFMEMNLHRIYCGTTAANIPMQRIAAALGMREEGRRRDAAFKHGQFVDVVEYGVLREEFLAGRKGA